MGNFNINITASGGHGCDRKATEGEKLFQRCGKFNCPDCMAHELVQRFRQAGMLGSHPDHKALFTHWPDQPTEVVDDMMKNQRVKGQF